MVGRRGWERDLGNWLLNVSVYLVNIRYLYCISIPGTRFQCVVVLQGQVDFVKRGNPWRFIHWHLGT